MVTITRANFVDMKTADSNIARSAIYECEKIIQRKYDGTAGIMTGVYSNTDFTQDKYEIIGRGIKAGEQQNYSKKFFDLIPSMKQFCRNIAAERLLTTIALAGEIVHLKPGTDKEDIHAVEMRCNREKDIEIYAEKYPATFIIFDIIEFNGNQFNSVTYKERIKFVRSLGKYLEGVDRFMIIDDITTPETKKELLDKVDSGKYGIEGVVIKESHAWFGNGTYKYKFCETHDVFWEGEFKVGNGRRASTFGSLVCYQYVRGVKTKVASVGGGFNDETLAEVMEMIHSGEVSKDNPKCMSVQAHEVFEKTGAMRYPNFCNWRPDKGPEQCISKIDQLDAEAEQKVKETPKKKIVESLDEWL